MTIDGFTATADLVGRRVRVAWEIQPAAGETIADAPPVTLRRKLRDYAFPPPAGGDPYVVYDSGTFPPAPIPGAVAVTDLEPWEVMAAGTRTVFEPVSVAVPFGGRMVEILRRTVSTSFDATGTPLRQRIEILDSSSTPGDLEPNTVYYYQLFGAGLPGGGSDAEPFRSATMVTNSYGFNRTLYDALPEIYRRHDVTTRPVTAGAETVPELAARTGQLRRFIDLFGVSLDSLRGTAEGLLTLHSVDSVHERYLSPLAQWIGWDLDVNVDIPLRRNEIKTAPRLYRLIGTLPGLRALVTQLTGWSTQVAELAQNVALSNQPPQRNLFAITADAAGPGWHGVDDSADALGFRAGNQRATGTLVLAAALTGTVGEPFALRAGMELTLRVDGLLPATVRFGAQEFATPGEAKASEVAVAINRALSGVTATAAAGRVVLTSATIGQRSALEIVQEPTSLISLEGAPGGRLSAISDPQSRLRIFYEARETPTQPDAGVPAAATTSSLAGSYVHRIVRYKTWADGAWRGSRPAFPRGATMQGDPAGVLLPDDRSWVAWIDAPQTPSATVRFATGSSRLAFAARLAGQRREPFALRDGAVLALTGSWAGLDEFKVNAAEFADVAKATAAEVVGAMNLQLTEVQAAREADGSVALFSKAVGAHASIRVELALSSSARALGFDQRNAVGANGTWDDEIDWGAPLDAVSIEPGWVADLSAVRDPVAGVSLAWARHRHGLWRICAGRWRDQLLVGTNAGVFAKSGAQAPLLVAGVAPDVRAIAMDADGTAWIATAAGVTLRRTDDTLAPLTPALPSADVRHVALGPDGTAWISTAAGVAVRAPNNTLTLVTTAQGLPSNDVRAVALAPDGVAWIATAGGLALRSPEGVVSIPAGGGVPTSIRDVAVAPDGTVYVATANRGLAFGTRATPFDFVLVRDGLPSPDVRAVRIGTDGRIWVATAAGVGVRASDGSWTTVDLARGLPTNDVKALAPSLHGGVWAGTSAGLALISPSMQASFVALPGGAIPEVRAIHVGWSAPRELAATGGGNREPALGVDQNLRTWMVWSQRVGVGTSDESWALRFRVFDAVTRVWGPEQPLTAPPVGGRAADRSPSLMRIPGAMRVFFSSDRNGGFGLWSVDVTLSGVVSPLVSIIDEPSSDVAPVPMPVGAATWLLYRSDRNVALAQVGSSPREEGRLRSVRVPDNGTVRRYAGHVTTSPSDLVRARGRRTFGDMLSYTPCRPDGAGRLRDDELYTRGTIGLYVTPTGAGSVVTQAEITRLRELLTRFMPANLRALVLLATSNDVEFVYTAGDDIQESYRDTFPFAEAFGAIEEKTSAAMPSVVVLLSNVADNVSADPANLVTLRRRTFFPPIA